MASQVVAPIHQMIFRNLALMLAATVVSVLIPPAVADAPTSVIESHGFRIDAHRISAGLHALCTIGH
jgi:hypothetical protein